LFRGWKEDSFRYASPMPSRGLPEVAFAMQGIAELRLLANLRRIVASQESGGFQLDSRRALGPPPGLQAFARPVASSPDEIDVTATLAREVLGELGLGFIIQSPSCFYDLAEGIDSPMMRGGTRGT